MKVPLVLPEPLERIWVRVENWPPVVFLVRCLTMFLHIDARDRVFMLAGQGFIAIIPLFIVVASFTGAAGADSVGDRIIENMSLTDSAAEAVTVLFAYPPGATGGITLFSIVLLLFSLNGFARSVQRIFEGAWELPRMGMRGTFSRTAGLTVLIGAQTVAGLVWGVFDSDLFVFVVAAQLIIVAAGWLVGTHLLLSRRTPFRSLVLGSLFSAVVQLLVGWGSALYLPRLFERQAERYGVIGVALALVTWLIVVASVIVGAAIIAAVLGTDPAEAPERSSRKPIARG